MPSGCSGDDFIRVGLPSEWLWVGVVVCDVSIDCSLQIDDADKGATFEAPFGQYGKEAFNRIQSRGAGRREVEGDARVASEPRDHLGMFVGGIVVEDDVDGLLRWNRFFDGVEEADELLMAMALHTPADHLTFEYVEGSKQRGGTVTLVIMGHGAGAMASRRSRSAAVTSTTIPVRIA